MFTHAQIWAAIDPIAEAQEVSVSALAQRAGLDATAFNRPKRVGPDGPQLRRSQGFSRSQIWISEHWLTRWTLC